MARHGRSGGDADDEPDAVSGHAEAARRRVALRRDEILSATVDHVDKVGLAAVRVADVAAVLGVSTSLVFYHFGTKDELIASALEHAVEADLRRLDKAVARAADPLQRVQAAVRAYGPTGGAQGWRIWIDAWALAQRDASIRALLRRLDARWCAALQGAVEEGVAAGAFDCPDPRGSVARMSAVLDGLSVACLVYGTVTRAQLRRWSAQAVALELGLPQEWVESA